MFVASGGTVALSASVKDRVVEEELRSPVVVGDPSNVSDKESSAALADLEPERVGVLVPSSLAELLNEKLDVLLVCVVDTAETGTNNANAIHSSMHLRRQQIHIVPVGEPNVNEIVDVSHGKNQQYMEAAT